MGDVLKFGQASKPAMYNTNAIDDAFNTVDFSNSFVNTLSNPGLFGQMTKKISSGDGPSAISQEDLLASQYGGSIPYPPVKPTITPNDVVKKSSDNNDPVVYANQGEDLGAPNGSGDTVDKSNPANSSSWNPLSAVGDSITNALNSFAQWIGSKILLILGVLVGIIIIVLAFYRLAKGQ